MEPKQGRQIVSKGEYMRTMVTITRMRLEIAGALFTGILFTIAAFGGLCRSIFPHPHDRQGGLITICFLFAMSGGLAYSMYYAVIQITKQVKATEAVVPLTRANTADLPAPESLVRASSEPLQAQEFVLLRAAAQGVDTLTEQLVRASVGQE